MDVYVAGYEITAGVKTPVYWKNGVITRLSQAGESGQASSIAVSGQDIYVTGSQENSATSTGPATVWKNGTPTNLAGAGDARANRIFVVSRP